MNPHITKQVNLRLPEDLVMKLKYDASLNKRSLSGWVIQRLADAEWWDSRSEALGANEDLRDHFAGLAMEVVSLPDTYIHGTDEPWSEFATGCYELADAMLKARSA